MTVATPAGTYLLAGKHVSGVGIAAVKVNGVSSIVVQPNDENLVPRFLSPGDNLTVDSDASITFNFELLRPVDVAQD